MLVAVIVFLFALARISSIVVDWAWFSSIGYVAVFWTACATKAALFVVVFAVSTLLLWANATLALRFTSRRPLRLPAAFDPGFATFQASAGPWAGSYGLQPSPFVWRLLTVAVAVILGLLIAWGETGRWGLILRFIDQTSYGRNDPLFDKDNLACCRFRGHREKVFDEAGGGPWEGECFRENSRLRRFG